MTKHVPENFRFRQIHLDFHTSEHIEGVGADFDPDQFVQVLKDGAVSSVTLFGPLSPWLGLLSHKGGQAASASEPP